MRVGLVGDNSIGMIEQVINIWNNGDCVVLVDWRIPFKSVEEMLESVGVEKCHIEQKLLDNIKQKKEEENIEFVPYDAIENRMGAVPKRLFNKFSKRYYFITLCN